MDKFNDMGKIVEELRRIRQQEEYWRLNNKISQLEELLDINKFLEILRKYSSQTYTKMTKKEIAFLLMHFADKRREREIEEMAIEKMKSPFEIGLEYFCGLCIGALWDKEKKNRIALAELVGENTFVDFNLRSMDFFKLIMEHNSKVCENPFYIYNGKKVNEEIRAYVLTLSDKKELKEMWEKFIRNKSFDASPYLYFKWQRVEEEIEMQMKISQMRQICLEMEEEVRLQRK